MPGKWGGAHRARTLNLPIKTRTPGKWGGARRARPPLDPPMKAYWNRTTDLPIDIIVA